MFFLKKIILVIAMLFLLILPLNFAGDCGTAYFKSGTCGNFSLDYFKSSYTYLAEDSDFITATGELDHNIEEVNTTTSGGWGQLGIDFNIIDDSNVVASYNFNGNVNDFFGNYNLTCSGTEDYSTGLWATQGGEFDNATYCKTSYTYTSTEYAIGGWFKTTATGTHGLISTRDPFSPYKGFGIDMRAKAGKEGTLFFGQKDATYDESINPDIVVNDGRWHHVVGQFTGTKMQLFIDGKLAGEYSTTSVINKGSEIFIGRLYRTTNNYYWDGQIEDAFFYAQAMTEEQVSEMYLEQKGSWLDENLIAYYKFNESSGTTVFDSARGNNGTLVANANTNAKGMWDTNSLYLDGTGDYVTVADNKAFHLNSDDSWSASAWVRRTVDTTGYIVTDLNSGGTGFRWYYTSTNDSIVFLIGDSASSYSYNTQSFPFDNDWHHVAITYSGCEHWSCMEIYIDGISNWSNVANSLDPYQRFESEFMIGQAGIGGANEWNGHIDEVKFWNKALTEEEIIADYNSWVNNPKFISDSNSIIAAAEEQDWNRIKINENLYYDFGKELESPAGLGNELITDYNIQVENIVGLWHLNDDATDSSENGNNGTWSGTEDYSKGLFDTSAGEFDGSSYISIGSGLDSIIDRTKNYAISLWFNANNISTSQSIFENDLGANNRNGIIISSGTLYCGHYNPYTGNNFSGLQSNTWYHVVLVNEGGVPTCYVNGSANGGTSMAGLSLNGGTIGYGSNTGYFNGRIEEVTIWGDSLSAEQVNSLYLEQSGKINSNSKTSELNSSNDLFNDDLIALYHLNENANDSSGNSSDGTWDGTEKYTNGLWNTKAGDFDTTNYINTQSNFLNGENEYSFSFWVKPKSYVVAGGILTNMGSVSGKQSGFLINSGSKTISFAINGSSTNFPTNAMPLNKWTNFILTNDPNGNRNFYVDGQLVNQASGSTANFDFDDVWKIGFDDRVLSRKFNGLIEEVGVWSKALTEEEIEELYSSQASQFSEPNMVGLWHLNGNALDFSGNLNNGTWIGSEDYTSGLWDTQAGNFDGSSHIDFDTSLNDELADDDWAVSTWVKTTQASGSTMTAVANYDSSGRGLFLRYNPVTKQISWGWQGSAGKFMIQNYDLADGLWHNILVQRTANTTGELYIDGLLAQSQNTMSNTNTASTDNLKIGYFLTSSPSQWIGEIEEVAIWNKVFTADKVLELYRKGISKLDLNIYSCDDANCTEGAKTSTQNISDINNNEWISIDSVSNSQYLGYEAYFLPIDEFVGYGAERFFANSFLEDFEVTRMAANSAPEITFNDLNGEDLSEYLIFSQVQDGNLTLDFNVLDLGDDRLRLTVGVSASAAASSPSSYFSTSDGEILNDLNISSENGFTCSSYSWEETQNCIVNLKTDSVPDGNFYLKIILKDSFDAPVYYNSDPNNFGIDNTGPVISLTNTHQNWNRNIFEINLSNCSDEISNCQSTTYQLNGEGYNLYTNPVDIIYDGNYQLDFNAVDSKGNVSDTNTFIILKGFNGILKTYSDLNLPESYFGDGEVARLIFDVNNSFIPEITIKDSLNQIIVDSNDMNNISQDANFGSSDYNTYYFDFTISGEVGWYDVIVENQLFEDAFYKSNVWLTQYEGTDSNIYPFTVDFNVVEPSVINRWFYPVDTEIDFNFGTKIKSMRLLDYNDSHYKEIPAEIYNETYGVSGNIIDANLVFLSTIGQGQTKKYYLSYTVVDQNYNYQTDLDLTKNGFELDYNTSNYFTRIDINKGGVMELLRSKIGTNTDFNDRSEFENAPELDTEFGLSDVTDVSSPAFNLEEGQLRNKISTSSTFGTITNLDLNYTLFAKNNFILLDINLESRGSFTWEEYVETEPRLISNFFNTSAYLENGIINTQEINGTNDFFGDDINYILVYNIANLDSIGHIFLENNSSKPFNREINFRDSPSLRWERIPVDSDLDTIAGDYYSTKKAIIISNPAKGADDINNILISLNNPLTVLIGDTNSNDNQPPAINSINFSPSDINDQQDLNCYTNVSDDTLVNTVTLNFVGNNLDYNYVESVLSDSATVSYLLDSNYINGGQVFCRVIVTDAASNSVDSNISLFVKDTVAPVIYGLGNTPDGNADIDPNQVITVDANISEYLEPENLDVNLYYRLVDGNWQVKEMNNNTNYNDVNYNFDANFTATTGTWEYYVTAEDVNDNKTTSSTRTIYAYLDKTWTHSPSDFGNISGSIGTHPLNVGTININNTGDVTLNFRITSDWDIKNSTVGSFAIRYDGEDETSTGYIFSLTSGNSISLPVTLQAKNSQRQDALTITIDSTTSGASPDNNTSEASIISFEDGAFLFLEFTQNNTATTQGDSNLFYIARITNLGNASATDVNFDWNYPSDWVLASGNEVSPALSTLAISSSQVASISFNIPSDANTGSQELSFEANCCGDIDKTNSITISTLVIEQTTGGDTGGDTGGGATAGGGGGDSGGGGSSGGGLSFDNEAQRDLFFQSSEFFELIRGEDNSFPVKFENPLDGNLVDLTISVDGLLARYLSVDKPKIAFIDRNQSETINVSIVSPRYFTPGEYELTFTIDGIFVNRIGRKITFSEQRSVILLIHDTNESQASLLVNDIKNIIDKFNENSWKFNLGNVLEDANRLFNNREFDNVKELFDQVNEEFDIANQLSILLATLENNIARSKFRGIETPNTERIFNLAKLAFERGDYAVALERAKEAELTYGLEVKGEFNLFYWLAANWYLALGILFSLLIAAYMFYLGVKIIWYKRKLKDLNAESRLLLSLISDIQKKCFVENRMSIGEYYDALSQFEKRLATISEDIIEYGSKLANVLTFRSALSRFIEEKHKLLDLLKSTQKEYFEKGLVETRIYHTKVSSLTKKLSEVEEQIVLEQYKKTKRISKGLFRPFWSLYYKVR